MEFVIVSVVKAVIWIAAILGALLYLQWVERKVIAHIQVRLGPSRVGPHGLLQPLADVIKLLTKEDLVPPLSNKFLYVLAPFLAVSLALIPVAVIPLARSIHSMTAYLAIAVVLTWHLYHTVFKERNNSIFTGLMSEQSMRQNHPLEHQRIIAAHEEIQTMRKGQ